LEDALQLFTFFILVVSVFLSFVLRKLIRDIHNLKEFLSRDLRVFTARLVEESPSLDKYLELGILHFRHEEFARGLKLFERLVEGKVFLKEAHFYQILCLAELKKHQTAQEVFLSLDPNIYSQEELDRMDQAISRKWPLMRWIETLVKILLTRVPLQYSPQRLDGGDPKEMEVRRILTGLPTRYTDLALREERDNSWILEARDEYLKRRVRLEVAKEGLDSAALELFLEHPRILAQVHSRSFPQVYDLHRSDLVYYSQERFEGEGLSQCLGSFRDQSRLHDFLRLWIAFYTQVELLQKLGYMFSSFSLALVGYDARHERLFFLGYLRPLEEEQQVAMHRSVLNVFLDYLSEFDIQETFQNDTQDLILRLRVSSRGRGFEDERGLLERTLEKLIYSEQGELESSLDQLGVLEKIHRASIHGLKGKFSIVKRYGEDSQKLLRIFFRTSNVEDIKDKMEKLIQYKEELVGQVKQYGYPICDEILVLDDVAVLDQLESLSRICHESPGEHGQAAVEFLKVQYLRFGGLSDKLATFILLHEVSPVTFLESYLPGVTEQLKIGLDIHPDCQRVKIRALDRAEFLSKISLILDNLINNAFEAGAGSLSLQLRPSTGNRIHLDVLDDGQGLDKEVQLEIESHDASVLENGGTGLIASKNACESIGGRFMVNPEPRSGKGTRIRMEFQSYAA
jgi:signal transduction histidine kinase